RPKLTVEGYDQLVQKITDSEGNYDHKKDMNLLANKQTEYDAARDWYLTAGTSKRIWNELYKVVDSSDVILHVLDARDPEGTRCRHVEKYIKTEAPHKHLVYILNKVDLVPTWVTARWVKVLSREYPTLAFHASINHSFGKGSLIQLLRQFTRLHADKKQISVGLIGYPNTGKSSIINTLRQKKVCTVAPVPGETKVWQYITMTRRIYLIDCPGIVQFSTTDTDTDIVLKGSIRTESLLTPEDYIPEILTRVRKEYIQRHYNIDKWDDADDFLTELAKATGKLNKGGEPDLHVVSKMVVNDWVRGRLPHYRAPPEFSEPLARSQQASEGDVAESNAAGEQTSAASSGHDETDMAVDGEQDKKKQVTLASLNVNQVFSKIPVLADYLPVDLEGDKELRDQERLQKIADDEEDAEKKKLKAKGKADSKRKRDKEEAAESDDAADWDEVFQIAVNGAAPEVDSELESNLSSSEEELEAGSDAGEEEASSAESEEDEEMAVDQDDESEDETKTRKAPRMKTNKMKVGKHYYPGANVKNRNRNKVRLIAPESKVKRMRMPGLWTVSKKK
ncbi:GTPase required for pre-60S ribosomal subunit nuclear export and maturation, partial [Coemansia thaxteri]